MFKKQQQPLPIFNLSTIFQNLGFQNTFRLKKCNFFKLKQSFILMSYLDIRFLFEIFDISYLSPDFIHLFPMLVKDVLPDKLRALEFLATDGTQPLVFGEFLSIQGHKLLHLCDQLLRSNSLIADKKAECVLY